MAQCTELNRILTEINCVDRISKFNEQRIIDGGLVHLLKPEKEHLLNDLIPWENPRDVFKDLVQKWIAEKNTGQAVQGGNNISRVVANGSILNQGNMTNTRSADTFTTSQDTYHTTSHGQAQNNIKSTVHGQTFSKN